MSVSSCVLRHSSVDTGHRIADTWDTLSHNVGYLRSARHHRVYKWTHNLRFSNRRLERAEAAGTIQLCQCQLGARPQISVRGRDDDNLGPTFLSTWVSPAAELSRAEIDGGWRVGIAALGSGWQCVDVDITVDNNKTQWRQGTSPARDTAPSYHHHAGRRPPPRHTRSDITDNADGTLATCQRCKWTALIHQ